MVDVRWPSSVATQGGISSVRGFRSSPQLVPEFTPRFCAWAGAQHILVGFFVFFSQPRAASAQHRGLIVSPVASWPSLVPECEEVFFFPLYKNWHRKDPNRAEES